MARTHHILGVDVGMESMPLSNTPVKVCARWPLLWHSQWIQPNAWRQAQARLDECFETSIAHVAEYWMQADFVV
jgi:hypothetical protein